MREVERAGGVGGVEESEGRFYIQIHKTVLEYVEN